MSSNSGLKGSPVLWIAIGFLALLIAAIATPNLLRSRTAADQAANAARQAKSEELHSIGWKEEGSSRLSDEARKLIRTSAIVIFVSEPDQTSEQIVHIAEDVGGYVVTSQVSGSQNMANASIAIRIPAAKFEQVRAQIRKLGLRVESESLEAQDVTKQYVDQEARLRNLRAQEQQYLGILRKASTVKDTLEVSDKLNDVRGAIEEKQAEFEVLSKQVEMVAMNITLRAEADTQVFGLHWRPLYQLKIAAREGLEGIGDYATSMAAFVFYLPTILLWLFTILAGAAIAWRILRWAGRTFFKSTKDPVPEPAR